MADLQQSDEQAPESRTEAFGGGIAGGGLGAHIASSLPRVAQANPAFNDTSSVLMAANQYSGVGLGVGNSTLRISNPYGAGMRDLLKQSGDGKAEQ